ncbi:glycosyltransferase family 2 protein [Actinomyces radicidentis]|uniref:glycosyltransferase family 2 protein n=1 Tax=Actinomyces radicidentis TaxID=111015 RepID=UPI0026DFEE6A|nr:glycosyltransferase family A protein [Actinomyces radicidentis]
MPAPSRTLDVAVCTYRRPERVTALIPLLLEQGRALEDVDARVVIVDNDAAGSARDAIASALGGEEGLVVVVEEAPGLTAARNRALSEAEDRDLLVFIDDDETPHDGWLAALLALQAERRPAGVAGPVLSAFEAEPDAWVAASPVWTRRRRATGTPVPSAGAGNLLLDMSVVRRLGLCFDPRFAFTGGEDTFFTRALVRDGGELLWCDEAVATESVPADRLTREWVLTRARRNGEAWAMVRVLTAAPGERRALRARLAARGAALAAVNGARARLTRDVARRAELDHRAAGALGILRAAMTGRVTEEYAR